MIDLPPVACFGCGQPAHPDWFFCPTCAAQLFPEPVPHDHQLPLWEEPRTLPLWSEAA